MTTDGYDPNPIDKEDVNNRLDELEKMAQTVKEVLNSSDAENT